MQDLAIISIQDGVLLGLRFKTDTQLRITGIIGSDALEEPGAHVVQGFGDSEIVTRLPFGPSLSSKDIATERSIHMLPEGHWYSEQTRDILLHQFRQNLRCNMVSPLAALAALQLNAGGGITYVSKQREIFLNQDSIELRSVASAQEPRGYVCGSDTSQLALDSGDASLLSFESMRVEVKDSLRSELRGLGHLFALTVGAALHLVNSAAPHTINNS